MPDIPDFPQIRSGIRPEVERLDWPKTGPVPERLLTKRDREQYEWVSVTSIQDMEPMVVAARQRDTHPRL